VNQDNRRKDDDQYDEKFEIHERPTSNISSGSFNRKATHDFVKGIAREARRLLQSYSCSGVFADMPIRSIFRTFATIILVVSGCAGPGPKMMPAAPAEIRQIEAGVERVYDANCDGMPDYVERSPDAGPINVLRFDIDGDGQFELAVSRETAVAGDRHLIILLDSIPFDIVYDVWTAGRLRLFHAPSRTISPFPVMTDLSFSEFFGVSPSPAVESEYFDGKALCGGFSAYASESNAATWLRHTDYHLRMLAHGVAYLKPDRWYMHELGSIQRLFYRNRKSPVIGYVVGTSALGARQGRNGHVSALTRLDRMCQQIMFQTRGRVQITLLSDHGHHLMTSRRVPLRESLERMGYHATTHLRSGQDIVVPEFGVVTCAAIHTRQPAQVARDAVNIEGIDFAAYQDGEDVVVVSRRGNAQITAANGRVRYLVQTGDPLGLSPIIDDLTTKAAIDSDGFVDDRVLFSATMSHLYPDGVHRLWRAFHGLIEHTPDVLVSLEDGWHCGSKFMSDLVEIRGAHGSLRYTSSCGFAMTTLGPLPAVMRMDDLSAELAKMGVEVRRNRE
jgi:hypothetical protein